VRITESVDTLFTYHRTWETGLELVTRVTDSNPFVFPVTYLAPAQLTPSIEQQQTLDPAALIRTSIITSG